MFDRLANLVPRSRKRRILLLLLFALPVAAFLVWLPRLYFAAIQFRDNLIGREYEGSLSTDLGLLVALTSEAASQTEHLAPDAEEAVRRLEHQIASVQAHLRSLRAPRVRRAAGENGVDLNDLEDDTALLRLLVDPSLAMLPLGRLGVAGVASEGLPAYPHIQGIEKPDGPGLATSFVFVPASGVEATEEGPDLSLQTRRELVFSKIAARQLRPIVEGQGAERVTSAYYIGCADFIRVVFVPHSSAPPAYDTWFKPLRSFTDRTYFYRSMAVPGQVRQSHLYLDVTGGGFVRTISAFVDNPDLGLCGMVAADITLQPLDGFWQQLGFGVTSSQLRDFTFATFSLSERKIGAGGGLSASERIQLEGQLVHSGDSLSSGIHRWPVGAVEVFSVPKGQQEIGLLILDPGNARRKYLRLVLIGAIAIGCLIGIVWLTAASSRAQTAVEEQQGEILDNLQAGFLTVDREGSITTANEPFRAMVGVQHFATDATIETFLAPESAAEYRKRSEGRGRFEFAGAIVSAAHTVEPVIVASAPLTSRGRESRMFMLIPSRELEQAIASRFLNVFSHALKSPVHSILLIADLFRRRNALPRFDEYFGLLTRKVQEFRTLTDNVLRFSAQSVKDIQVSWESVNVAGVLRAVLTAARERAKAAGLELRESIPDRLRTTADSELLKVVFNNLIDNAIKYTQTGYVKVHGEDRLTHLVIEVEDSGPGVPAAERERIFALFAQGAAASATSDEGLGLGLFISRLYLGAMGASLRYQPVFRAGTDADGDMIGSRFIVEIPKRGGQAEDGEDENTIARQR